MSTTEKPEGAVVWTELQTTPEESSAVEFYSDLFGWAATRISRANGSDYIQLELDGVPFGGIASRPGETSRWLPYFAVSDVDAVCEKAFKVGTDIDPLLNTVPGRVARIADPTGAEMFVIGPAKSE